MRSSTHCRATKIGSAGMAPSGLFILLVLATMFPKPAMSQVLYGSLVGKVTDASDAPGVPVKITHVETNESRTSVPNTKELHNA